MRSASKVTAFGVLALLCGAVSVPACSSGGDDDDDSVAGSNSGGSAGTGGSAGSSAGTSTGGSGGSSGGGGETSQVATECPGVIPSSTSIANFDDAPAAADGYTWGSAEQGTTDFWGGVFNYPAALELSFAGGEMTASGNVADYAGFGLYVQNCADASSFEGVRFKIKGNPPMGKLAFAVQTNANEWATGEKGSCLAPDAQKFIDCVHPSVAITGVTEDDFKTVEVTWAQLGAGKPAASAKTDGSDVIGLQFILPWAEKATPYDATITIDDVELIGEGSGVGGAGSGGAGTDAGGAGGAK